MATVVVLAFDKLNKDVIIGLVVFLISLVGSMPPYALRNKNNNYICTWFIAENKSRRAEATKKFMNATIFALVLCENPMLRMVIRYIFHGLKIVKVHNSTCFRCHQPVHIFSGRTHSKNITALIFMHQQACCNKIACEFMMKPAHQ